METKNISEWKSLGMCPKKGERPVSYKNHGKGMVSCLFTEEQVRPIAKREKIAAVDIPVTPETVLAAAWAVNRSAKRYRDAASGCYQGGAYQFASSSRAKKESLYELKDRAIAYLHLHGAIEAKEIHGGMCLWCGGGYSFHSKLSIDGLPENKESLFVDAKPKGKMEMRLKDAVALLEKLPQQTPPGVVILKPPAYSRRRIPEYIYDRYEDDDDYDCSDY